ncbi:MAG: GldM family protein, partial [Bacteroidota bacterium]
EGNYAIEITNGGGSLSKTGKNEYIVRVNSVMDTFSIRITQNGREILRKQFKTRSMPEPFATWNGLKNTTASRSSILTNPFLIVLIPHYYFRGELNIVSFRATFVRDADSISTYSGGNQFTNEQIGIIKLLKSGDKIYFDNIIANNSKNHGEIMWDAKLSPFWIKIE